MIKISAQVKNSEGTHHVSLTTNDHVHEISIPPKPGGLGSNANGGELLFLALATCYCNDLYREAARRSITVRSVQVEVSGEFHAAPSSCAENVIYKAVVEAEVTEEEILELMRHTDTVVEIQNSLRKGVSVILESVQAVTREAL